MACNPLRAQQSKQQKQCPQPQNNNSCCDDDKQNYKLTRTATLLLFQTDLSTTNHRRQQFPPSLTLLSFKTQIQSVLQVDHKRKFSKRIFQLLQCSRQCPSFPANRAALVTTTDLTFPAFSLRFVDFAIQFCFHCKFSFL